jgi:hypothetical protein
MVGPLGPLAPEPPGMGLAPSLGLGLGMASSVAALLVERVRPRLPLVVIGVFDAAGKAGAITRQLCIFAIRPSEISKLAVTF